MSGSRDYRPHRRGVDDDTVEVPLQSHGMVPSQSAEEPWWKNVNTKVPPPPEPAPRSHAKWSQPPAPRTHGTPDPARNRNARPGRTRRTGTQLPLPLLIAAGAIAIAAAAVLVMVGLSRLDALHARVLDVSRAEAGVARILTDQVDGYGTTNVSDVVCNGGADPEIKKGGTFTCEVVTDGRKRQVLVVFRDDNGTYEVDRPR